LARLRSRSERSSTEPDDLQELIAVDPRLHAALEATGEG